MDEAKNQGDVKKGTIEVPEKFFYEMSVWGAISAPGGTSGTLKAALDRDGADAGRVPEHGILPRYCLR